jgi:hypothetical protein
LQEPGARPTITPIDGANPAAISRGGVVNLTLKPWGAMILSTRDVTAN